MALAYDPYYDSAEAGVGILDEPTPMVSDDTLDKIQFGLMGAGFTPGPLGIFADLADAGISLGRGDLLNAGLASLAALPLGGSLAMAAIRGGRKTRKVDSFFDPLVFGDNPSHLRDIHGLPERSQTPSVMASSRASLGNIINDIQEQGRRDNLASGIEQGMSSSLSPQQRAIDKILEENPHLSIEEVLRADKINELENQRNLLRHQQQLEEQGAGAARVVEEPAQEAGRVAVRDPSTGKIKWEEGTPDQSIGLPDTEQYLLSEEDAFYKMLLNSGSQDELVQLAYETAFSKLNRPNSYSGEDSVSWMRFMGFSVKTFDLSNDLPASVQIKKAIETSFTDVPKPRQGATITVDLDVAAHGGYNADKYEDLNEIVTGVEKTEDYFIDPESGEPLFLGARKKAKTESSKYVIGRYDSLSDEELVFEIESLMRLQRDNPTDPRIAELGPLTKERSARIKESEDVEKFYEEEYGRLQNKEYFNRMQEIVDERTGHQFGMDGADLSRMREFVKGSKTGAPEAVINLPPEDITRESIDALRRRVDDNPELQRPILRTLQPRRTEEALDLGQSRADERTKRMSPAAKEQERQAAKERGDVERSSRKETINGDIVGFTVKGEGTFNFELLSMERTVDNNGAEVLRVKLNPVMDASRDSNEKQLRKLVGYELGSEIDIAGEGQILLTGKEVKNNYALLRQVRNGIESRKFGNLYGKESLESLPFSVMREIHTSLKNLPEGIGGSGVRSIDSLEGALDKTYTLEQLKIINRVVKEKSPNSKSKVLQRLIESKEKIRNDLNRGQIISQLPDEVKSSLIPKLEAVLNPRAISRRIDRDETIGKVKQLLDEHNVPTTQGLQSFNTIELEPLAGNVRTTEDMAKEIVKYFDKGETVLDESRSIKIVSKDKGLFNGMRGNRGRSHMNNAEAGEAGWLGNPHKWEGNGGPEGETLEGVIEKFETDFLERIKSDDRFKESIINLRGAEIGYYNPGDRNHLEVVAEFLEKHTDDEIRKMAPEVLKKSESGIELKTAAGSTINFREAGSGYQDRTKINANENDATLAVAADFNTYGEIATAKFVEEAGKPLIQIDTSLEKIQAGVSDADVIKVVNGLNEVGARSLNIAGNGIYTLKDYGITQEAADNYMTELLQRVNEHPDLRNPITRIQSGGQTGFDEAGVKAGIRLKMPTVIVAPKNWLMRTADKTDVADKNKFMERFKNQEPVTSRAALPMPDWFKSLGEGTNISSGSANPLLAALTNPTELALKKKKISQSYPVTYNGKKYKDAEAAYQANKVRDLGQSMEIMSDIIRDKFLQHEDLYSAAASLGEARLSQLSHRVNGNKRWEGNGLESNFITALVNGFKRAEKIKSGERAGLASIGEAANRPIIEELARVRKVSPEQIEQEIYGGVGRAFYPEGSPPAPLYPVSPPPGGTFEARPDIVREVATPESLVESSFNPPDGWESFSPKEKGKVLRSISRELVSAQPPAIQAIIKDRDFLGMVRDQGKATNAEMKDILKGATGFTPAEFKRFLADGADFDMISGFDEFAEYSGAEYQYVSWGTPRDAASNYSAEDKSAALWELLTSWIDSPHPEYNAFFNKKGNALEEETRAIIEKAYEYARDRKIDIAAFVEPRAKVTKKRTLPKKKKKKKPTFYTESELGESFPLGDEDEFLDELGEDEQRGIW